MNGVVLMTALVPTIGHAYLVSFASNYMDAIDGKLHVIVCGRSKEPTRVSLRIDALIDALSTSDLVENIIFHAVEDDYLPQNPSDHPDFWNVWRDVVFSNLEVIGHKDVDFFFASEMYGVDMAKALDAEFVPCDIDRSTYPIKGSSVRADLYAYWDYVLPLVRKKLRRKVTFFGAESTGKTTASQIVASCFNSVWLHEWARPYLEKFGPATTEANMKIIENAQYAAQMGVYSNPTTPLVVQDTDLLSTIGYYRIYSGREPESIRRLFAATKSDLYVLMPSNIPFAEDPLRYGGNKRESSDEFWVDLLDEFECNYVVLDENRLNYRAMVAVEVVEDFVTANFKNSDVSTFERE